MFTGKLYKTWDGDIYYWQIFSHPDNPFHLIASEGLLGGSGRISEAKCENSGEAQATYDELMQGKKLDGYQEAAHLERMTLQFDTDKANDAGVDLAFKDEMLEYLEREMYWSGNGSFTGGNIGAGYINLSLEVVSPGAAVSTIVQALAEKRVDRSFVVVHEVPQDGGGFACSVIYPDDMKLVFQTGGAV